MTRCGSQGIRHTADSEPSIYSPQRPSLSQGSGPSDPCFWPQIMLPLGLSGHTWGIIPAAGGLACLAGSHLAPLPPFGLLNALTSPNTAPKIYEGFKAPTLDSIQCSFCICTQVGKTRGWVQPLPQPWPLVSGLREMARHHQHSCCG